MYKIRKMKQEDTNEIFEMMRIFYDSSAVIAKSSDAVLKKDISDCISDMPFIEGYVIENDEKTIGYSMIAKSYSTEYGGICLWIEDLYIKPEYRHMGISKQFFDYIENIYNDAVVRYRLEAELENEHAVAAYRKSGFSVLPYVQMTKEV